MPDTDLGRAIAKNLKRLLYDRRLTSADLSRALGIRQTTVSGWMNEYKVPRGKTIDAICEYLHCTRTELIGEEPQDQPEQYYLNPETARIAQDVYDDPDLRLLFDASRDSKPEDIRMAAEMLRRFKETNPGG